MNGATNPQNEEYDSSRKPLVQQTQAQIEQLTGIMRENIGKVLQREEKLNELDDRAEALVHETSDFKKNATKIKRKMWYRNMKMKIILGTIAVIFVILLLYWVGLF